MVGGGLAGQASAEIDDGLLRNEVSFRLEGRSDLPQATLALGALCTDAETSPESSPLQLELAGEQQDWPGEGDVAQISRWEREVRRLERLPRAIVASVRGICTGPALDLLLASDLRVASPDTVFRLSVNDKETWPGMTLYRLVLQIGLGHARRMILFGQEVDAHRAAAIGLIDEVHGEPARRAGDLAAELAGEHGKEVSVRRALALEAAASAYEDALGAHLAVCSRELRRLGP